MNEPRNLTYDGNDNRRNVRANVSSAGLLYNPFIMLVQIYEISSSQEAAALGELGVDHIGVLVGDGSFPRERTIDDARLIFFAIPSCFRGSAFLVTSAVLFIRRVVL